MGGDGKTRREQVQELLAKAQTLVEQATKICEEEELDGVSFMDKTFRCYRNNYDGLPRRINAPGWYTDDYWCSSDAHCEIYTLEEEED